MAPRPRPSTEQPDYWQVETSRGMVQGKYLIAADGSKGTMAKKLGLNQRKVPDGRSPGGGTR